VIPVHQSLVMGLRIYVPDLDWVKGNTFGLQFVQLRPTQGDRLALVFVKVAEEAEH
jgi:hypothetical protein